VRPCEHVKEKTSRKSVGDGAVGYGVANVPV